MSSLFGTNTVLSTWRQIYPLTCDTKTTFFKGTLSEIIHHAEKAGVINSANDYSKFIDLYDNMDQYCSGTPMTIFAFSNTAYDSTYKNLVEYDKLRVAKAHSLVGALTTNLIKGKYSKLSNLSRKWFYVDPESKIFKFINLEPIIIANIEGAFFNDDEDHSIMIYFIDFPLYDLTSLYLDDMS